MRRTTSRRGLSLPFALILAACFTFLILTLAGFQRTNSRQANYVHQMDRTMQLAESGLNRALGLLSRDPQAYAIDESLGGRNNEWIQVPSENGSYQTKVNNTVNNPFPGIYYIVTKASRTVNGQEFIVAAHSYARVSNVADYFAAVNDTVIVSHPTDLSQARIYGLSLQFERSSTHTYPDGHTVAGSGLAGQTVVRNADFVNDAWPPVDCVGVNCTWSTSLVAPVAPVTDIVVTNSGPGQSFTKLAAPLLLPQILPSDLVYYQGLAGVHVNQKSVFTGHIFPPGYNEPRYAPDDDYVGHTTDNNHHVWYHEGDVSIRGIVHGQVIIVSTGDIHITGPIQSADNVVPAIIAPIPGFGTPGGIPSQAHQLVLIPGPGKNVYIDESVYDTVAGGVQTVKIEAMVVCPNGTILMPPNSPNKQNLKLNFRGSMILGTRPNFSQFFAHGTPPARVYAYMDSLRTTPPPFMPTIVEIYHSLRQVIKSPGLHSS